MRRHERRFRQPRVSEGPPPCNRDIPGGANPLLLNPAAGLILMDCSRRTQDLDIDFVFTLPGVWCVLTVSRRVLTVTRRVLTLTRCVLSRNQVHAVPRAGGERLHFPAHGGCPAPTLLVPQLWLWPSCLPSTCHEPDHGAFLSLLVGLATLVSHHHHFRPRPSHQENRRRTRSEDATLRL